MLEYKWQTEIVRHDASASFCRRPTEEKEMLDDEEEINEVLVQVLVRTNGVPVSFDNDDNDPLEGLSDIDRYLYERHNRNFTPESDD